METPLEIERRAGTVRELDLRIERRGTSHVILHMGNEFVAQNYYLFDEALERLAPHQPGSRIELEMSHVPYADSEALGRLAAWSKRFAQAGASLIVVNPTPYVTSIMELLRLDATLAIVHRHSHPHAG